MEYGSQEKAKPKNNQKNLRCYVHFENFWLESCALMSAPAPGTNGFCECFK